MKKKKVALQGIVLLLAGYSIMAIQSCQSQAFRQGEILYTNFCANCHMKDGTGLEGNIPPLAGSDYLEKDPASVACIIRYGLADTILVNGKTYDQPMAAIPQLSEFEIANIINYINHSWGNDYGYVRLDAIQAALQDCATEK